MPSSAAQDAGDPGTPTDPEGSLHKNLGLVEVSEYPPEFIIGPGSSYSPDSAFSRLSTVKSDGSKPTSY